MAGNLLDSLGHFSFNILTNFIFRYLIICASLFIIFAAFYRIIDYLRNRRDRHAAIHTYNNAQMSA